MACQKKRGKGVPLPISLLSNIFGWRQRLLHKSKRRECATAVQVSVKVQAEGADGLNELCFSVHCRLVQCCRVRPLAEGLVSRARRVATPLGKMMKAGTRAQKHEILRGCALSANVGLDFEMF